MHHIYKQHKLHKHKGPGLWDNQLQTIGGLGALTGPQAYQPFMSPYQQQVIDATLSEYDKSRLGGQQQIRDQAVMPLEIWWW